ncbi:MAG: trypsin-like peptidase domain-containing protein [Elusimicrobia bacterium]|nr:trypsin-like peptidase domain-containing protein [Elusimicrobiota bacterium]
MPPTNRLSAILLAAVLLPGAAASMPVYDDDDRQDPPDVRDDMALALADSTAAIFESSKVAVKGRWAELDTKPYAKTLPLCDGERFADQDAGADCSAALVGPDLVLTAGHCVKSLKECRQRSVVFGFRVGKNGKTPTRVPAGEVYGCSELLGRKVDQKTGSDWALFRLDRQVAGHDPLNLDTRPVTKQTPLLLIGHPKGLPEKVASNGRVRDASPAAYFVTDLDSFHGNSGSPVFHAKSGGIVGVLVRGDEDFDTVALPDGSKCLRTKVCRGDACQGEIATKVSEFAGRLPGLAAGAAMASEGLVNREAFSGAAFSALKAMAGAAQ